MTSPHTAAPDRVGKADSLPTSVAGLLALHDARFVRAAYHCILLRSPDPSGFAGYLARVRAGVPKLQIVQELAHSDEGRRARAALTGLDELPPLPVPRRGLWARLIDRVFGRGLVPTHQRLNALENSIGALADGLDERLSHLQGSVSRQEARTASSLERLHAQRAPLHVSGGTPATPSSSVRTPFILEIAYDRTASPASVGQSDDTRELAIGYRAIELFEISTGECLCRQDLVAGGDSSRSALFGFSAAESWGSWSTGAKSALVLWLPRPPRGGLRIRILGSVFDAAFTAIDLELSCSSGHRGWATMVAGTGSVEAVLEAPLDGRTRPLFFGDMDLSPDPLNLSLVPGQPVVSVVILNYNKPVLSVLASIAVANSRISVPYEILIVDNGSDQEHWRTLGQLNTLARLVRVPVNRFFGEGNNLGVEQARGTHLLLLNNDAFPAAGCVDELLQALASRPGCGAACPVFVYPDGRMQEAGAFVRPDGTARQRGKQEPGFDVASLPRFDVVDYGSAACLLVTAEDFRRVGGFNYRYDPAYYEDTDLCFRLRLLGKHVALARDARCTHIENATTADKANSTVGSNVVELNRQVFLSTWRRFLDSRRSEDLPADLLPPRPVAARADSVPSQVAYTPFPLVPGGGERYLLSTAEALAGFGTAALATSDPFSQMRLDNVLADLGLPVGRVLSRPWAALSDRPLERLVVMGNECLPRVAPVAASSFFHCQFPFPWPEASDREIREGLAWLKDFRCVIVNSEFTRRALLEALAARGATARVEVVFPPVGAARLLHGGLATRKPQILSIGRFTDRGHAKRQDILIEALKATSASFRRDWTLVLCGSVPADPHAKAYFERLRAQVGPDLRVEFVISPTRQRLDELLWESAVYAHAAGYGVESPADHWRCEHFGISIVEALAAGCSTLSYGVGGGPEIAALTGAGSTFLSVEELAHQLETAKLHALPGPLRHGVVAKFDDQAFLRNMGIVLA